MFFNPSDKVSEADFLRGLLQFEVEGAKAASPAAGAAPLTSAKRQHKATAGNMAIKRRKNVLGSEVKLTINEDTVGEATSIGTPAGEIDLFQALWSPVSLAEAEQRAGFASWVVRGEASRLIDVAHTRDWLADNMEMQLQDQVRAETESNSFFLDSGYGGTTVVLSFGEAKLAEAVIKALRSHGVGLNTKKPSGGQRYSRLSNNCCRGVRLGARCVKHQRGRREWLEAIGRKLF